MTRRSGATHLEGAELGRDRVFNLEKLFWNPVRAFEAGRMLLAQSQQSPFPGLGLESGAKTA